MKPITELKALTTRLKNAEPSIAKLGTSAQRHDNLAAFECLSALAQMAQAINERILYDADAFYYLWRLAEKESKLKEEKGDVEV